MSRIERHSLLLSGLLCALVIFASAWPVLRQPRLEADDYRYLHLIQQWRAGNAGALDVMTVENRWDHLWFMQEEGRIRFFRPTVVLSYAIDQALWGDAVATGLTLSNVWIHLACALLVAFLFHRLLGSGWPAITASVLFAGLATHAECIWYVAGRTDSLAALGLLGAFALHVAGRRWWALPLFAFGFITKEMVIVAPVVFAACDRWIEQRKIDRPLFSAYAVTALAVLAVKRLALGGEGSDWVYPYLISPLSPQFAEHLWLQFRSYAGNLLAAEITVPFADAPTVALLHRPWVPILGTLLFLAAGWMLRRDRRFWLFLLLGGLAWLPTSFVYLSERYLYLPSVAFAGLIGLAVATRPQKRQPALAVLLGVYALFHTAKLTARHVELARQPGSVQEMIRQLEPVLPRINKGGRVLLVNTPGLFVRAQFAQDILRVVLNDPALNVDVLTMMPGQNGTEWMPGDAYPVMGAGVQIRKTADRSLRLEGRVLEPGQPPHPIQEPGLKQFNWAPLDAGLYTTPDLEARILAGKPAGATSIDFTFFQPLETAQVILWKADCSNLNEHPWLRRKNATTQLLQL